MPPSSAEETDTKPNELKPKHQNILPMPCKSLTKASEYQTKAEKFLTKVSECQTKAEKSLTKTSECLTKGKKSLTKVSKCLTKGK